MLETIYPVIGCFYSHVIPLQRFRSKNYYHFTLKKVLN